MLMSNCTHSEIDKWSEFAKHEIFVSNYLNTNGKC